MSLYCYSCLNNNAFMFQTTVWLKELPSGASSEQVTCDELFNQHQPRSFMKELNCPSELSTSHQASDGGSAVMMGGGQPGMCEDTHMETA